MTFSTYNSRFLRHPHSDHTPLVLRNHRFHSLLSSTSTQNSTSYLTQPCQEWRN
ncbi:hypothetical protein RchiOBHm_Chr5g0045821 [Rosa chinensis]|uniref:Uncharacterized protein n=1 Tax=Rosa chinensis TaxID=74649 RepID=A0A2P6QE01_ROSCH|nr:hypothetical protein RchiOBHm_Chr5g0045821 [Rosa chinensis]